MKLALDASVLLTVFNLIAGHAQVQADRLASKIRRPLSM